MNEKEFKQQLLDQLYSTYVNSMPCHLGYKHRNNIVFGEGNPNSKIVFIGEAPGREEDLQGRPFVGRSGLLLNKALKEAGIIREDIYITNIIKCRPPDNRTPLPEEIKLCTTKFLNKQIKIINPKIIVVLGSIALNAIMDDNLKITKVHGLLLKKNNFLVIPIYHPSYILRNNSLFPVWLKDIKNILTNLKTI